MTRPAPSRGRGSAIGGRCLERHIPVYPYDGDIDLTAAAARQLAASLLDAADSPDLLHSTSTERHPHLGRRAAELENARGELVGQRSTVGRRGGVNAGGKAEQLNCGLGAGGGSAGWVNTPPSTSRTRLLASSMVSL